MRQIGQVAVHRWFLPLPLSSARIKCRHSLRERFFVTCESDVTSRKLANAVPPFCRETRIFETALMLVHFDHTASGDHVTIA